jgi:hypothetical protein
LATVILEKSATVVRVNQSTFEDGLAMSAEKIKPIIADTRPKMEEGRKSAAQVDASAILALFDNPIISMLQTFSPVNFLMTTVMDGLHDLIKLPDLEPLAKVLSETITTLFKDELDNMQLYFEDIKDKVNAIIANPSLVGEKILDFLEDTFWTIWDAFKKLLVAGYKAVVAVFDSSSE